MNKNDLVVAIAGEHGLSQRLVSEILDTFVECVRHGIDTDGEVTLRGFGSLRKVEAAARTGRNIRTGATIAIPARARVKFRSYIKVD